MDEADAGSAAVDNAAFVLSLRERGVRDTAVLRAMEQVPREIFVPPPLRAHARRDIALPLRCGQSMTAPTVLAAMLSGLAVRPGLGVLEIGTGSGYASALLMRLGAAFVRSIERYGTLAAAARDNLAGLAITDLTVETGDGLAPAGPGGFARILVNGAIRAVPEPLAASLAPGGRLVAGLATDEGIRLLIVERAGEGPPEQRLAGRIQLDPLTPGRARML